MAHRSLIVGITGGIGSGKTTVAKCFQNYGVPIYFADDEAKALMNRSKVIRRKLIALFGDKAYINNTLNRDYLRAKIFNDTSLLSKMNAIVHPKVASHFKRWLKKQNTHYILKEAAIIFENNLEHQYDYIITVVADEDQRICRVMQRDGKKREEVLAIIKNQLPDNEKVKKSDFVIYNNNDDDLHTQIENIHKILLSKQHNSEF